MHRGLRLSVRRLPALLFCAGLLFAFVPGCGDAPVEKDASAGGIPKVLKSSNDQMENFMKSQQKSAKKK